MTEYQTKLIKPRGKGTVRAFSTASGKWTLVNWKYVAGSPTIYPRWRPTPDFRWTKGSAPTVSGSTNA